MANASFCPLLFRMCCANKCFIFFVGIQWADQSSLDVINILFFTRDTENPILTVAYRDEEVDKKHPAMTLLKQLAESGRPTRNINVAFLDLNQLDQSVGFLTERKNTEITMPHSKNF